MTDSSRNTATRSDTVVTAFLEALMDEDLDGALDLVADDIVYTNVPFPPLHGRDRLDRLFRPGLGRMAFRVHNHHVAVDVDDDGVVLTDRIDALILGPVHWQFWVSGRFQVRDGRITVWRDSFDFVDLVIGLVRGLLGARVPSLARRWPSG